MDCGHGWRSDVDCEICRPPAVAARALRERVTELDAALRGIINHWNEFGDMMGMKDDYGLSERMDAAAKLIKDSV